MSPWFWWKKMGTPMVGKVLAGRYEVLDRIGQGGMALVYRARDLALNRMVALKILKPQWAQDDDVVNRFVMEARAAASLDGQHIVQVYDVGADDDCRYIVMELVQGTNLKDYLAQHGPLDPDRALAIADQVAEALSVAHARHVVHRDIKPQNILLAEDGTAKVTDFGIARAMSSGTLVNTGSILGTAQYLSPEQARGRPVGPGSDLYGLGAVLYEMLTGSPPFSGESPIAVALRHIQEPVPDVREVRPDVPEPVARLVAKLLAKDPEERYSSAAAVRERIAEIREGKPDLPVTAAFAEARPSRPAPRRRKWVPWAVAAAVVLLLAAGGYLALARWLAGPPPVALARVVGLPLPRAEAILASQGFQTQVVGQRADNRIAKGRVVAESPTPGTRLRPGSTLVSLVVSSGPELVAVPYVVGDSSSLAVSSLTSIGLKTKVRQVASASPADEVVHQYPEAGQRVRMGTVVLLTVSNGSLPHPTALAIPNLTGQSTATASTDLAQVGMTLGAVTWTYSTLPAGTIIDQSPAPYGPSVPNGQVDVVMSEGLSPASSGTVQNQSQVSIPVPATAPANSVIKLVVTDAEGNEEVYWAQVAPGQTVTWTVTWYGPSGQLTEYLNGQQQGPPTPLQPAGASPSSSAGPSSSASSASG
jgi:serine/threonine-protein kinase